MQHDGQTHKMYLLNRFCFLYSYFLYYLFIYLFSYPGIPNGDLTVRHIHPTSAPLGISGAVGSLHLPRPHHRQQDTGMMGKPYSQYGAEPLGAGGLEELRGSSGLFIKKIPSFYQFVFVY